MGVVGEVEQECEGVCVLDEWVARGWCSVRVIISGRCGVQK